MSSSSLSKRPRVRHHTSEASLDLIKAANAIEAGRGSLVKELPCVHVEMQPFGPTRPTPSNSDKRGTPKNDLSLPADGAYVEFDLPNDLPFINTSGFFPMRNTGEILTDK